MAKQLFTNNAKAKLNAGILAGDVSLNVQAGQGALFPNPSGGDWFLTTLIDTSGNIEIIKVTARTGDAFTTIVRAQEGTASRAFNAADKAELRWTAGSAETLRDNLWATAGTRLVFQQTAAPTYWTKEAGAAYNDAAMRIVTGAVGPTGGADAFTTLFGAGKSTAGYVLTIADMPAHGHAVTDPTHNHLPTQKNAGGGGWLGAANAVDISAFANAQAGAGETSASATGISIQNTGGGGSHAHTLNNMNLKYVDHIVAAKD